MSSILTVLTRRWRLVAAGGAMALLVLAAGVWRGINGAPQLLTAVRKGPLVARLTVTGTLKPIQVATYRSPLVGREAELIALVAEGTLVKEGDLVARLDTSALAVELDRARQDARRAEADQQLAQIDQEDTETSAAALAGGEASLTVDEARSRLLAAERRATRLREELTELEPLLEKGFLTREELNKTSDALDAANDEVALLRRRLQVLVDVTGPRDLQRSRLQRAQKVTRVEEARTRLTEARVRLRDLEALLDSGSIYARRPGLVVHEELMTANPRRKVRVGDRVTSSQGLLSIPEVDRMVLETSVSESEVRRVRPGQRAAIHVEAFPDLPVSGVVARVGTLARPAPDRAFDDKRFDVFIELETVSPELRPEMTARADVVLLERQNVLLAPVTAIFSRGPGLVAYVSQRGRIDARSITIGESDGTHVEVVAGVAEGDLLMVVQPDASSKPPVDAGAGAGASRDSRDAAPRD